MFVLAAILAGVGVVLFLSSQKQATRAQMIGAAKSGTVAELSETASSIAAELGPGAYTEYMEVKGKAVADPPLKAEYSGTECVWYECVATREYEEEEWEEDEDGKRHREMVRGSEEVSRIKRDPPFYIDDGTGKIKIDPKTAELETEQTYSQFEPETSSGTIRVGMFSFNLGGLMQQQQNQGGKRTLGYKFEERCIPVGRELFVLGEASDAGGTLTLRKSEDKNKRFIVSLKSKETIIAAAKKSSAGSRIAAIVAIVAAIALVVFKLFGG